MKHLMNMTARGQARPTGGRGAAISAMDYKELLFKAETLQASADELLGLVRLHDPMKRFSVKQIQRVVATDFKVPLAVMTGHRRGPQNESWARMVAMYLARELTDYTSVQIGKMFGNRDHGTVLNAFRMVENRMVSYPATDGKIVQALLDFLKAEDHRRHLPSGTNHAHRNV